MTDEAAGHRRPADGDGPPDGPGDIDRDLTTEVPSPPETPAPAPSPTPPAPAPEPDPDPRDHAPGAGPWAHTGQASGAGSYAAGGAPHSAYSGSAPPPGTAPFTSRYGLVRPREGRYLAGVCAAIGRATNTDPVLWRVLLAVLGFFGGIGIVVYVAAWLIIPAEGDTASPVESMLGRGRSSMSPILVIILGILVAVLFGYIVTDTFRAILLGAAVLIGGALLLNRDSSAAARRSAAGQPTHPGWVTPPSGTGHPATHPPAGGVPAGFGGGTAPPPAMPPSPVASEGPSSAGPSSADPVSGYPSWYRPATAPEGSPLGAGASTPHGPWSGGGTYPAGPTPAGPYPVPGGGLPPSPPLPGPPLPSPPASAGAWPVADSGGPPTRSGYRPPFAPHGPYAPAGPPPPAQTQKRAKPPKPPRERSPLGAATFSMIFVAIGVVAILDLVNSVSVHPSTYFAAVLITIALGLLVGAWFGRARWLIALGLVTAAALGISTLAESYDGEHSDSPVVWRPASHDALAVRYQARFGNATLDLRQVDFTGQDTQIDVRVDFGTLRVILPPDVDTTVVTEIDAGDAQIFDTTWSGLGETPREVTDLGDDGTGGGFLRLSLQVRAGDAEVSR